MRKLLIVDDEKNIRRGLQAMIEREYEDVYDIRLACDAFEALDILKSENIDLLITDIRMPEMDGIGLIKSIQDFNLKPVIVIVSGYDDFSYAKAAIRYEVKEYLLKPVIREELAAAIKRAEEELVRRAEVIDALSASSEQREEYMESQLNYYAGYPSAEAEEVRERLAQLELDWMDHGFHTVIIKYAGDVQAIGTITFKAQIHALIEQLQPAFHFRFVRFLDRNSHAVILTEGALAAPIITGQLMQADSHLNIAVSGLNYGMEKLYSAYEEAAVSLKHTFMLPAPGIVTFEEVCLKDSGYQVPVDTIKRVANMLGSGRETEMLRLLHEILDAADICPKNIGYLEGISRALNEIVFNQSIQLYGKEESAEMLQRYNKVSDLYQFSCFQDYYREAERLFLLLDDYLHTLKSVQMDNKEMKKALQYIQENYAQNINMTIISNLVSFNYSYFSQAFREYTGENFVNYLKKYRIGKAKQLLQTTDDMIYEIAKNSGFENTKNFNRVFKESEGVSPVEYRNQQKVLSAPKDQ